MVNKIVFSLKFLTSLYSVVSSWTPSSVSLRFYRFFYKLQLETYFICYLCLVQPPLLCCWSVEPHPHPSVTLTKRLPVLATSGNNASNRWWKCFYWLKWTGIRIRETELTAVGYLVQMSHWVVEDLVWLLLPENNYTYKAVKVWCLFCSCYQFDRC